MMKGLVIFVVCLKLSSGFYSYGGRNPLSWGDSYPNCDGQRQSPIKLDTSTKNDPKLKDIEYSSSYDEDVLFNINYADHYEPFDGSGGPADGNQITLEFSGDSATAPTISGSYFGSDSYKLEYIRCAFAGDGDEEGSEHKIGYQKYAGECQFYHKNTRTEDTVNTALEDTDANVWAVLAFFVKATKTTDHHVKWDDVIDKMLDFEMDTSTDEPITLKPMDLIPKHATDFYFYQGSVTHPPCLENVNWHIFTKPIEISDDQLKDFQMLMKGNGDDLFPNIRPIQHLNLRKVIGHIKKKSSSSYKSSSSRRRRTRHTKRPSRRPSYRPRPSPHHRRPRPYRRPHGPHHRRPHGYSSRRH
eukprot:TRINITY_DN573_c0_g1_i1.p1 TRINITY_DN573_c0_g1~~TRINITY_DN573_c0_g1_i1.p1  ORF type:complete len:357 (-),score=7.44 TRINITY_DN573_c0_g1_i1:103-1173(-)